MHTIFGAGGAIANELAKELVKAGKQVRLVGRNPKSIAGTIEMFAADATNREQTIAAVRGSTVVYLTVGLPYKLSVWQEAWPRIMENVIEACKRARAKLIFFDNVYMYGRVNGRMTEATPFNPCSKKGEIRAQIATTLLQEMKSGNVRAMIARAPDFYGPNTKTGIPNVLVFDKMAKGARPLWLSNDSVKHSFAFTQDAAKSLVLLAGNENSWNQIWHIPTAVNPPTGKEFIGMAAEEFGIPPKYRILSKPMVRLAGLFDPTIREIYEMLYQNDSDYIFDSAKFARAFNFEPTSYAEGIRLTAAGYRRPAG